MTRQIFALTILCIGAALILTTPVHADTLLIATTPSYDSPVGYDFATTFPTSDYQNIGAFVFTIPADQSAASITISGTFGNGDGTTTALSDYYLGYAGNEMAVEVAACDDPSNNCYSGQEGPYTWTATLTQAQILMLEPALANGSIDFGYTWDSTTQPISDPFFSSTGFDNQYVYAGAATLKINAVPEPSSLLLCFTGLIGLAAFRRFRTS